MASFGSKLLDTILIGLGIAIIATSSIILNNEKLLAIFVQPQVNQNSRILGLANSVANDVRRRSRGSLSWFQLQNQHVIYSNDTIFSGKDSGALLELQGQNSTSDFELGANTLVQLLEVDGETLIDLQIGSISSDLQQGQKFKVKLGEKVTDIASTSGQGRLQIVSSGKKSEIFVEQGKIAATHQGRTDNLDKSQILSITPTKNKLSKPKIELLAPLSSRPTLLKPGGQVVFKWKATEQVSNYKIEIAEDHNFRRKILVEETSENKFKTYQLNKSKTYFWRVKNAEDKGVASRTRTLRLVNKDDLQLNFPPDGFATDYKSPQKISFNWSPLNEVRAYRVQLSRDEEFSEIFSEHKTKRHRMDIKIKEGGKFYWRVQAKLSRIKALVNSEPSEFTLEEAESPTEKKAPVATKPSPPKAPLLFEPMGPPELMGPPKPPDSVLNAKATDEIPTELPEKKPPKKRDPFRDASIKLFETSNLKKKVDPAKMDFSKEVEVSWEGNKKGKPVEVAISRDPKFKTSEKIVTREPATVFTVNQPGTYYIRTRYLRKNGKPVKQSTRQTKFDYKAEYHVKRPSLKSPSNNLKLVAFGKEAVSIYFEWKNIGYADSYTFQLASDKEFKSIVLEKAAETNSFFFNENLQQKKLYWRVKAHYKDTKSKWSKYRKIQINSEDAR